MKKTNTTAEPTAEPIAETTATPSAPSVEINEYSIFDYIGKSPLNPKDPDDGWSYYWGSEDDNTGSIGRLRMRGYDFVRVGSDAEIPTYGGERRPDGTVAYGNLVLLKRPKELSDKELEAKRRQYKRLANQKIEEAEEEMKREGAEHQPNRRTFYFAENPLAK
jgi:hypothetical protein